MGLKAPPRAKRHKHARPQNELKTTERGLGADHRRQRLEVMEEHNWMCARCEEQGRVTLATDLHHIVPRHVDMSKRMDHDNVRPLCKACHAVEDGESDSS